MSYHRYAVPALAFAVFTAQPAAASTATIAQILGSPSSYDGHHVDVKGTVEHLQRKISHKGNPYVTYSLCSDRCIRVFAYSYPTATNGQTMTVHGTYQTVDNISGDTLYNGIQADGSPSDPLSPCG